MNTLPALCTSPPQVVVTPVVTRTVTGWPDEVLHIIGQHHRAGTLAHRDPEAVTFPDGRVSVGITILDLPAAPLPRVFRARSRVGRDAVFAVLLLIALTVVLVWVGSVGFHPLWGRIG